MGAGAPGGWVMIGLGFGASEEDGELGFCNVFAGGWRGHLFFAGEVNGEGRPGGGGGVFFWGGGGRGGGGGGGGGAFDEKEGRTVVGRSLLVRDCEWEY